MTIKIDVKPLFFILLVFILFSCSKTNLPYSYKNQELNGKFTDSVNVIEYKTLVFEGRIEAKVAKSYGDITFSLSYPYIKSISMKSNANLTGINSFIFSIISFYDYEKKSENINNMRDAFFHDYLKDKNETESGVPWMFDEKITIQSIINDKIFFKVVTDSLFGSAHGTIFVNYAGYDLSNKGKVSLSDIINDKDKLNEIGEKYFRITFNLLDESLESYFFPDNKFQLNENFYLTDDFIVFYFNPYEINNYVDHQYKEIVIPLSEIEELLKISINKKDRDINIPADTYLFPVQLADAGVPDGEQEDWADWSISMPAKTRYGINKYGYIDKTGKEIIPFKYESALDFSEGLAAVQDINDKWGFIDKNGKVVIDFIYDIVSPFSEGLARMGNYNDNGGFNYVLIDKNGKNVTGLSSYFTYFFGYFSEGLAYAYGNVGLWGFIDKSGKTVIDFKYNVAVSFSEGLAAVQNINDKWGFIDKDGNEVIPFIYYDVRSFSEGLAAVKDINDKWGFIDKSGNAIIPFEYDYAGSFAEGLAAVRNASGNCGYINNSGKVVIDFKYDGALAFSEGLASVRNYDGKYGFIDKTGKEVILFKYDRADPFRGGLSKVYDNNSVLCGFIDKSGKLVVPFKYRAVVE